MQAINHIATALLLKKKFPSAPLFGLIVATEATEYLWVGLNLIGLERTVMTEDFRSVADVHLIHMPFSHSILTAFLFALIVGLIIRWRGGKLATTVALAMSLGIASHILLDLLVHAPDITLAPYLGGSKFGTGLYNNLPLLSLGLETAWGIYCWWIFKGSWKLLGLIVFLNASSIPFYSAAINTGEAALAGQSTVFALMILAQMLTSSFLVWLLARERSHELELQS